MNTEMQPTPSNQEPWSTRPLRRIIGLYAERRCELVLAFLLMLGGAAAALFVPFILHRAVNDVLFHNDARVHRLVGVAICLAIISLSLGYFSQVMVISIGERAAHRLRKALMRHIQLLPLGFLREHQTGYVMRRFEEVAVLGPELVQNGFALARNLIMALFCVGLLLFRDGGGEGGGSARDQWYVFLIIPLVIGVGLFFHRKLKRTSKDRLERWGRYDRTLKDVVAAIPTTRTFAAERSEFARVMSASADAARANIALGRLGELSKVAIGVLTFSLPILVLAFGAAQTMRQELSFADFVTLLLFIGIFGTSLKGGFAAYTALRKIAGNVERFGEFMSIAPERIEGGGQPLPTLPAEVPAVVLQGVEMRYPGRPSILRDVDLVVHRGQKIGLVGPNGSGKSTIFSLILGLEKPTGGRVEIGGRAVGEIPRRDLRRLIALVPQYPFMINGSIRDNVTLGRKRVSREELDRALASVGLTAFVQRLPAGLDTEVGEDGKELSYGERKRLAVARCLLRGAELILLDEATESLDESHQEFIQEMLGRALQDRTVIYISHRREELEGCDLIYAIADETVSATRLDDLTVEF